MPITDQLHGAAADPVGVVKQCVDVDVEADFGRGFAGEDGFGDGLAGGSP
jgi:hypothetical protein